MLVGKRPDGNVEVGYTFDGVGMDVGKSSDVVIGAEEPVGALLDVVGNPALLEVWIDAVDVSGATDVVGKSALTLRSRPSEEEPQAAATNAREREHRISRRLSILKLYSGWE